MLVELGGPSLGEWESNPRSVIDASRRGFLRKRETVGPMVRPNSASQSELKIARLVAARRLKLKESTDTQKESPFGVKDVSGYVWVLIPSVIAVLQIFTLANGSGSIALTLASSIDIRALVMGIFAAYTPFWGLLAATLSLGHIQRFLGRLDWLSRNTAIGTLVLIVGWCIAYSSIVAVILIVLIGGMFIVVRITRINFPVTEWGATALALAAIVSILTAAMSNQLLPAEVVKINTGQQIVGYVINPNQGGWATVLPVARSGAVYRFQSSAIVSRTVCAIRISKWKYAVRGGVISIIRDPRHTPFCPT
jgi:hypothetical protein